MSGRETSKIAVYLRAFDMRRAGNNAEEQWSEYVAYVRTCLVNLLGQLVHGHVRRSAHEHLEQKVRRRQGRIN